MAENKCPILEMKPAAMSLEEVFLEVTKDDTKHTSKRKRRLLESETKEEGKKKAETQTEEKTEIEKIETEKEEA
jgi:uncharacterized protein YlxW (UPF0749 family)